MGFLDFFKTRKNKEPETEINFEDVENLIKNNEKKLKEKEREIINEIKEKIPVFTKNISEKLKELESTGIASGEVEGRVRIIVKENLENYIRNVKVLLDNLSELEKNEYENINKFLDEINRIFSYFDKKSYTNYLKANHLVKKELVQTNKSIMNLSREIEGIFNRNKDITESSKLIVNIKNKLNQFNSVEESLSEFNTEMDKMEQKSEELKEKREKIIKDIEEVRKSEEYLENLKKIERLKDIESEIQREIFNFKSLIDFKTLANIFHNDKKKLEEIKSYKENLHDSFDEKKERILFFVKEANMKDSKIKDKISQIENKKEEFFKIKKSIKEDKVENLKKDLEEIDSEIEKMNIEKDKKNKRIEKPKINEIELKGEILNSARELKKRINNI